MDEWSVIAYGAFGVSAAVSLAQFAKWLLRATPQAIVDAGGWSSAALDIGAAAAVLWLAANGRWMLALMLAAFVMPVLAQNMTRRVSLRWPLFSSKKPSPAARADFGDRGRLATGDVTDSRLVDPAVGGTRYLTNVLLNIDRAE